MVDGVCVTTRNPCRQAGVAPAAGDLEDRWSLSPKGNCVIAHSEQPTKCAGITTFANPLTFYTTQLSDAGENRRHQLDHLRPRAGLSQKLDVCGQVLRPGPQVTRT